MSYVCNLSEKQIAKGLEKLERHKDIKRELYETTMYEEFPTSNPVTVEDYNAK